MDSQSALSLISEWLRPSPASATVDLANVLFRVCLGALIFFIHGLHKLQGALARLRTGRRWPLEREVAEIHVCLLYTSPSPRD